MTELETSTRIRCIIVGDESLTIRCAQFLLDGGHHVALIVSLSPAVTGWAEDQGLDHTGSFTTAVERLSGQEIDYLFSIANLRILPGALFSLPLAAAVNFHDGPLPGYCGLNVTSWAILNGEDRHAVSWHLITDEVDGGAILREKAFAIDPDETAFSLNTKCFLAGFESFTELVAGIQSGSALQRSQPNGKRNVFLRFQRPPHAAVLQFEDDAASLSALVRACTLGPEGAGYVNRLSLAKCVIGEAIVAVHALEILSEKSGEAPGTILDAAGGRLVLATGTTDVVLSDFWTLDGMPLDSADLLREAGLGRGDRLSGAERYRGLTTSKAFETVARNEPFWLRRLMEADPVDIPYARRRVDSNAAARMDRLSVRLPEAATDMDPLSSGCADRGAFLAAALCLFLSRLTGQEAFRVEVAPPSIDVWQADLPGLVSPVVPLNVLIASRDSSRQALERLCGEIRSTGERTTYCLDLPSRYPALRGLVSAEDRVVPLVVSWGSSVPGSIRGVRPALTISVADEGRSLDWIFRSDRYDREHIEMMSGMFETFLAAVIADPSAPVASMPILGEAVAKRVISEWNATRAPIREDACVHQLVEEQARRTPDAPALVFREDAVSFDQLNRQANRLARRLLVCGVEPGALVGIHTDRSLGMVVSMLAALKAGAAYVPIDPDFPADRLEYMVDHAGIDVVVTNGGRPGGPGRFEGTVLDLDADAAAIAAEPDDDLERLSAPDDLAYVIYTSGSTGRPKGVMIEHRQVVNFFAGMDEVVGRPDDGVWLAVTSLSFDISVLELLWTLSAGFKVVLYEPRDELAASGTPAQASHVPGSMDFSLFYFASDEGGEGARDKYRLLLEGAKFADANGFAAIWTPERHFHAFGGLYPNPSVAGAAVAAITRRVGIRAGSCVSPLHSAIRVAEEWSVVDNLSGGRVGIAFASGWQPHDFVLMPGNFPDRKKVMFQQIEEIRKLWRGEAVTYTDGAGKPFDVRTLPRPIQESLPVWITAAGSPDTFRMAGERGFNILTHLLGQTAEGLSEHIATYRSARREAGFDPDGGTVTLMLHTYVGDDDDAVRELVRGPMKAYLLSSVGLVKLAAEIPLFRQKVTGDDVSAVIDRFSEKDMDEVLDFSFDRYFETSGLFGTRETCLRTVDRLKTAGVDEIACLIDYGLSTDEMMSQMPALADVMRLANRPEAAPSDEGLTLKDLIRTHGVTHLQCTPSMASMLAADSHTLESLSLLRHMLVGGEAFPPALAARLSRHLRGRLTNMYGPTETTIWSATHDVDSSDEKETVPIGRPIVNTRLYVLDENRQPVPVGVPGELYIGGKGVARGYLRSREATEERFVADPFNDAPDARMYRTGDQVRFRTNGDLEFLGRLDHQVKIRGYRIELGEIEAAMTLHPDVAEAVVIVREDVPGDRRLTGYFVAATQAPPTADALRAFLARALPDYMIPSRFVAVDGFPMTPNRKIDRNALPRPAGAVERASNGRAPMNATEKILAEIWMGVLDVPRLEVDDNFFSVGGNSIVAMSLVAEIREAFGIDLPLVSLFRNPTISGLAEIVNRLQIEGASEEHLMAALADLDDLSEDNLRRLASD